MRISITKLVAVSALASVPLAVAQDRSLRAVKQAFDDANIPEDVHVTFDPSVLLEVVFPEPGSSSIPLHAGIQLPRNATAGPPVFSIATRNSSSLAGSFVVATVDPDAPTPQMPNNSQIRHFLGGDFTVQQGGLLANSTPAISPFRQPTPPAGSDPHRYTFLLFRQPAGFDNQTLVNATTPVNLFNISAFAAATGLGNPIGGTFMLVGPDPTAT